MVSVSALGVPKFGVVKTGDVASTLFPDPVFVTLTTFLLASNANAVLAVRPESVVVPLADRLVNAPEFAVVAPTVPLMLMLAVPVRFVTVPDEGVPNAPPLTTNAPELPVLTPRAVATPVPNDVIPVPPLATASVPPRVIAPVVALEGVSPVRPPLKELTDPEDDTIMFAVEYHCVVLDALNSI